MDYRLSATGSSGDVYTVLVRHENEKVSIHCSCYAGQNMTLCRHRIALLTNDDEAMFEYDDAFTAASILIETNPVKSAYLEYLKRLDGLKKDYKRLEQEEKKAFAHLLEGL